MHATPTRSRRLHPVVLFFLIQGPALFLAGGGALAQVIINVPGDAATIQQGIAMAAAGDTVLVQQGTYVENINFLGKAITVESAGDPALTIINGNQQGSVVTFASGEGPDSILDGFRLTNGSGTEVDTGVFVGGGIAIVDASSPTITNNLITQNNAGFGGGIASAFDCNPTITMNALENNSAIAGGGFLGAQGGSATITDNSVTDNSASDDGGGIVLVGLTGSLVSGNTISGNVSGDAAGGVLIVDGSATVSDNTVTANEAVFGGGFFIENAFATVLGNDISGNDVNGAGGAIYTNGFTLSLIERNTITNNSSWQSGGALRCDNDLPSVINNIITGNTAANGFGGGMYFLLSHGEIHGNLVAENTSLLSGGGIGLNQSSPIMAGNTITANTATLPSSGGGGIYLNTSEAELRNCIIWGNSAGVSPNAYVISGNPVLVSCDVEGGWSGSGSDNIDADPLFVDPTNGDYHISLDSPCLHQGANEFAGLLEEDFEGDQRVICGLIDIGADEAVVPPGECPPLMVRGDCDISGSVNLADAIISLVVSSGGGAPPCDDACDTNDDGQHDLADGVYTLSALFIPGSPIPPGPFPACGLDPTADPLGCDVGASCP